MSHRPDVGPLAFNTRRMAWTDLPGDVRERVAELSGAQVVAGRGTTTGFSPGFAGIVELADGRQVFVKATGEAQHPWSIDIARAEIAAHATLPETAPAPRLLWSDDGAWALAGFELIDGTSPSLPWTTGDLGRVFDTLSDLAATRPASGRALRPFVEASADLFCMWADFAQLPQHERDAAAVPGGVWGEWALRHLDTLVEWEAEAPAACAGDSLMHGDLRADNIVLDAHKKVWLVDWPWATLGAPWIDLAFLLPSVAMQGGGNPHEHFRSHPLGAQVKHHEIRAAVTVMVGYFMLSSWKSAPEQIPTLRAFQAGQALPAARWLQELEPWMA